MQKHVKMCSKNKEIGVKVERSGTTLPTSKVHGEEKKVWRGLSSSCNTWWRDQCILCGFTHIHHWALPLPLCQFRNMTDLKPHDPTNLTYMWVPHWFFVSYLSECIYILFVCFKPKHVGLSIKLFILLSIFLAHVKKCYCFFRYARSAVSKCSVLLGNCW